MGGIGGVRRLREGKGGRRAIPRQATHHILRRVAWAQHRHLDLGGLVRDRLLAHLDAQRARPALDERRDASDEEHAGRGLMRMDREGEERVRFRYIFFDWRDERKPFLAQLTRTSLSFPTDTSKPA